MRPSTPRALYCEEHGLVLDQVHIVVCVRRRVVLYACAVQRHLLLASLFSSAVGPLLSFLFTVSIMHRVVLDFSLCRLASCLGIILSYISVMFSESAVFPQVLVVGGAAAGCFDVLVCLSVCLSACHALRDVIMAFHELFGCEMFACVEHAHLRAARGLLD